MDPRGDQNSSPNKDKFCFDSQSHLKIGQEVPGGGEHPVPGGRQAELCDPHCPGTLTLRVGKAVQKNKPHVLLS